MKYLFGITGAPQSKKNYRYNYFITITSPTYGAQALFDLFHDNFIIKNMFLVCEKTKKGEDHFHIVLVLQDNYGLRKNTSIATMRNFLEDFGVASGIGIDIEGARNLKNILFYCLKSMPLSAEWMLSGWDKHKLLKEAGLNLFLIILDMVGYSDFDDWQLASVVNQELFIRDYKRISLCWRTSRNQIFVDFHGAVNKIEKDSFAKVPFNKKGHYPENLIYYLPIIIKLIHSLFFCDHLHWKNTKLFIVGPPRSGKTSLLRKIENILGGGFFWVQTSRSADFTGLHSRHHKVIVFDDVLTKGHRIPNTILLPIFGGEGYTGDRKYQRMINIPQFTPVIGTTNYYEVLKALDPAAKSRICIVFTPFSEDRFVYWEEFPIAEFRSIFWAIHAVLANVAFSKETSELNQKIAYIKRDVFEDSPLVVNFIVHLEQMFFDIKEEESPFLKKRTSARLIRRLERKHGDFDS